jgi:hypothetical protein
VNNIKAGINVWLDLKTHRFVIQRSSLAPELHIFLQKILLVYGKFIVVNREKKIFLHRDPLKAA